MLKKAVYVEKEEDISKVYLSAFYNAELGACRKLLELSNIKFSGN